MTAVNTEAPKAGAININSDPKKGIIRGTADINASPERVFRALTTEEQAEWWGHEGKYRTHEITPMGSGSRLSILHPGFEGREQMTKSHSEGWTQVFGWLAEYLAGK